MSSPVKSALENCEQIRGYYPKSVPKGVFENIDEIIAEIRRLEEKSRPHFLASPWTLMLIGGVGFFIYFILTHK